MKRRQDVWQEIVQRPETPVLILGGGVDGIGLYRDLALQGIDAILVDKADFAAGASSKSSRMIHGGLRYLENREFSLVAEAVRERNLLLENARHYISPLKTTIPIFSWFDGLIRSSLHFCGFSVAPRGRGAVIIKIGLMVYDFLTGQRRRIPRHFLTSRRRSLKMLPGLNPQIVATATYWDAWVSQIERLCIEMIDEAEALCPGSRALNYATAVELADGKVTVRDEATGEIAAINPQIVVNATGAWVDRTNRVLGLQTRLMGGTKGSHLVIDNAELHDALGDQMVLYEHADGRVCIVFRFLDKVIMGSTDLRIDNPDDAECTDEEVDYMMDTLHGIFTGIRVSREQIVFRFCGVRPLAAAGDASVTGTISRGHRIDVLESDDGRPFPVLCMVGGKLSTFRAFAEQTCDAVLKRLGAERRASTACRPIGGADGYPEDQAARERWCTEFAARYAVSQARAEALLERYGTGARAVMKYLHGTPDAPLASQSDYTVGEIRYLLNEERVEHLDDLICRRSLLAILGQVTPELVEELASIAGRELAWDTTRQAAEVMRAEVAGAGRAAVV